MGANTDPPPTNDPYGGITNNTTGTTDAASTRAALLKWCHDNGYPVPATTSDFLTLAAVVKNAMDDYNNLTKQINQGTGWMGAFQKAKYLGQLQDDYRTITTVGAQLNSYANELWGSSSQVGQQVSDILRPPAPSIQKLPTPEEFLGDYQNAFATHVTNLRSTGAISQQEADFATNQMQSELLQKYTGKMGQLAAAGINPYSLEEVTREQRGTAPGTPAGEALDKAYGKGVSEPTTFSAASGPGETQSASNKVQMQEQAVGTGVPKEFTSNPVIKPLDFLQQTMTAASIKLAYAGSQYGAGKPVYGAAPAGWTSGSRRA